MSENNQCLNCTEYLKTISLLKENYNRKLQLINTDNQILKVQIEKFCKSTTDFSEPVNNVQLLKQHIEVLLKTKDLLEKENKKLKLEKSKAQDVCASCSGSIKKLINQVVDTEFYKKDSSEQLFKGSKSNIESICKKFLNLEVCLRRQQEWSQDINEKYTNNQRLIEKLNKENNNLKFELETLKNELTESRNRNNADSYPINQKDVKIKSKNSKIRKSTNILESNSSENPGKSIFYEKNRKKIQQIEKMLLKIPKIPVEDEILNEALPLWKSKSNIDTNFNNNSKSLSKENLVDISNRKSIISENLSDSSNSPVKEAQLSKDSHNSSYSLRSGKIMKTVCNQNKKYNEMEEEKKFNLHCEDFNLSDSDDFDKDQHKQNPIPNDKSSSRLRNANEDNLIKGSEEIVTQKPTVEIEIDSEQIPAGIKESEKSKTVKQNKEEREDEIEERNIDIDICDVTQCYKHLPVEGDRFIDGKSKGNQGNAKNLLKRKTSITIGESSKKLKSSEFCNPGSDSDSTFIGYSNKETENLDLTALEPIVENNNNYPIKTNQIDNEIFQFNFSEHIQIPSCEFLIDLDIFKDGADNLFEDLPKSINENQSNSIILSQNSITTQSIQLPINPPIELRKSSINENRSHILESIDISSDNETKSIIIVSPEKSRIIPRQSISDESVETENEKLEINAPLSEYNFQMLKSLNIKKDLSRKKSKRSLENRMKNFLGEIFMRNTPVESAMKKYKIATGSEFVFDLFSRQFFAFFLTDLITNRDTFTDLSSPALNQSAAVISKMIGLCCEQNRALVIFHTRIIEDLMKLNIRDSSWHLIRFMLCVLFKLHSSLKQSHLSMTVIIDLLEHSKIPASIIISAIDSHFIDYSNLSFQNFQINILITFLKFLYHSEDSTYQIDISINGQQFWTSDRSDNPKISMVSYLREQLIRNPDCVELINLLFSIAKNRCYK